MRPRDSVCGRCLCLCRILVQHYMHYYSMIYLFQWTSFNTGRRLAHPASNVVFVGDRAGTMSNSIQGIIAENFQTVKVFLNQTQPKGDICNPHGYKRPFICHMREMDGSTRILMSLIGFLLIQFIVYPFIARGWRALDKEKLWRRFVGLWFIIGAIAFLYQCSTGQHRSSGCLNPRYEVC